MSDTVTLDYLFPADHAEVINGKLYVLGAGWSELFRPALANATFMNTVSVAVSMCIPSVESNRLHTVSISIKGEKDTDSLATTTATFTVGRPSTLAEGQDQHIAGIGTFNVSFPAPGSYLIIATVDGREDTMREWGFRVHDIAQST